jgi:20S proteasome alpha/beta subunit
MTLIIAAEGKDFVILGADSRATIESRGGDTRVEINFMNKITKVADHVAILLAGEAEVGDRLIEKFKLSLKRNEDGVSCIAEKLADFCIDDSRRLIGVPTHPNYFPDFGFIVAGLDERRSKYKVPRCYTLDSMTGFRLGLARGFAIDGKRMIAYYLFAKEFEHGMEFEDVCRLVAKAINDTKSIDGDVGGGIRMARIHSSGYTEVPEADIQNEYIVPWDVEKLQRLARK